MPSNKDFYDALTNLSLSAENVNLNVDQVETKLDTANGILTTLSTDIALIKPDVDDIRVDLANGVTINQPVAVTDNAGSLTVDGSVSVSNFPATQPVSGTVTANAGTGTFAVSAASLPLPSGAASETTLSSINTKVPSNLTVSATRLLVDGSGVTQPISGTVTANPASGSSATVSTFTATTNSQILASNSSRKALTIFNSTANVLYVRLGSGAVSSTNFSFALGEKELLSLSNITTEVRGIYAISGTAYVTEIT